MACLHARNNIASCLTSKSICIFYLNKAGEAFIEYSVFGNSYLRLGKRRVNVDNLNFIDISLRGQFQELDKKKCNYFRTEVILNFVD